MNKIFNLVKKELDKIFKNPRAILSTFILPGLLIFIIYTVMGNVMATQQDDLSKQNYKIAVVNPSEKFTDAFTSYNAMLEQAGKKLNFEFVKVDSALKDMSGIINFDDKTATSEEKVLRNKILSSIEKEEYNAWICFNSDFDEKINAQNVNDKAVVGVFGKVSLNKSQFATTNINSVIETMQPKLILRAPIDFSTEKDISKTLLASFIPMMLMIFVFAGGMSVGADTIAGEKERGTISTLLMTPIKRSHIIYGKIISLAVITILSAIGPFVAVILSIPQLMKSSGVSLSIGAGLSVGMVFNILGLVLMTTLLATSVFLVMSTVAKSVKEASMFASPIYILVVVLAVLATNVKATGIGLYFVPFMNIALALNGAITETLTVGATMATIFSTLGYCIILIVIAVKLFNSERILYSK